MIPELDSGEQFRPVASLPDMERKPLCIDLFCGLGGWAEGFLAEGWQVIGFDIERHDYGTGGYPGQLVLQDVFTLDGLQFRNADCIVASPPCQRYSYMAMPWDRSKREIAWQEWQRSSPFSPGFDLNDLFDACFRIQREASVAAGHEIPLIVENVCGAQRWVGSARWHFGSYYLWGDVPAIMPFEDGMKNNGGSWFGQRDGKPLDRNDPRDMRRGEDGAFVNACDRGGWNHPGKALDGKKNDGLKLEGNGTSTKWCERQHKRDWGLHLDGDEWKDANGNRRGSDRATARKAASAQIAKIPLPLAEYIARVFKPDRSGKDATERICAQSDSRREQRI